MTFSIYQASAPMFVALTKNMGTWLDKAEVHAKAKKFDIEVLMQARLAPDMIPLHGQIHIATSWAKNAMCRLAGQTPPDFSDTEKTFPEMKARIARTLDLVQSISEADLKDAATRQVNFNLGPEIKMQMAGADYLVKLAYPNFYFHVTTAYDILRHNGIELGKQDFLAGAFEVPGRA